MDLDESGVNLEGMGEDEPIGGGEPMDSNYHGGTIVPSRPTVISPLPWHAAPPVQAPTRHWAFGDTPVTKPDMRLLQRYCNREASRSVRGAKQRKAYALQCLNKIKTDAGVPLSGLGALNTNTLKYAAIGAAAGYLLGGRKVLSAAIGAAVGWYFSTR